MEDTEREQGNFSHHEACEKCGSSDGKAVYTNGTGYCFSCNAYFKNNENGKPNESKRTKTTNKNIKNNNNNVSSSNSNSDTNNNLLKGSYKELKQRGISLKTTKRFNYMIGKIGEEFVHVANYFNVSGEIVRQKIRKKDKSFMNLGEKDTLLFGQNLVPEKGKDIIITEGEIDCLSFSQILNHKTPVVSISNGIQSAKKELGKHLEFLNRYDNIYLAFDNDEHGRKGINECAPLFEPGKVKIVKFNEGFKDANDYLIACEDAKLVECLYNATEFRPDGILNANQLLDRVIAGRNVQEGYKLPYRELNEKLKGIRKRRITTIVSGSGQGKTAVTREIALELLKQDLKIGYIPLEESVEETIDNFLSLELGVIETDTIEEELYRQKFTEFTDKYDIELYDHFGSTDVDNLISKINYMATSLECDFIVLDHISMLVSGIEGGDERRIIDNVMTKLRSLVQRTGVGLILISHLSRPQQGPGHEEGGQTSMRQLRGSGAIGQISDIVIGIERNQQDEKEMFKSNFRVLKSRIRGTLTGLAGYGIYNEETGRIIDHSWNEIKELEQTLSEEEVLEIDVNNQKEIEINTEVDEELPWD